VRPLGATLAVIFEELKATRRKPRPFPPVPVLRIISANSRTPRQNRCASAWSSRLSTGNG
jgi:hypothetical protein